MYIRESNHYTRYTINMVVIPGLAGQGIEIRLKPEAALGL
jgi:hypothetical protein